MTRETIMVKLFNFSAPTYYRWAKHEERKIFDLLAYAFKDIELEEYLETGKIERLEKMKSVEILFDASIVFYRKLEKTIDFDTAPKLLNLLENSYKENESKLFLNKFVEELYKQDEDFFKQDDDLIFRDIKTPSQVRYEVLELFQKESLVILEYICVNLNLIITHLDDLKIKYKLKMQEDEIKRQNDLDLSVINGTFSEDEEEDNLERKRIFDVYKLPFEIKSRK